MGSITRSLSRLISSARTWIQASAVFLSNLFLLNLPEGRIYQGNLKKFCVPGLNCYSCPAASGACPVGALQAVSGSSKFTISFYVTGFLMMLGVLLGRFVCGFLCPFGWFQELLHKIPSRKFSTKKIKPLRYLKYAVLLIAVIILPAAVVNHTGLGDPYFCKYICPQGVLEGAIPLAAACTVQQDITAEHASRQRYVHLLQKMCRCMRHGCRYHQNFQSFRMYTLRRMYKKLSCRCDIFHLQFRYQKKVTTPGNKRREIK